MRGIRVGRRSAAGLTLLELLVVLLLLVAIAGTVIGLLPSAVATAERDATAVSLRRVRQAIVGGEGQPGYRGDLRALPATIADLLRKPALAKDFDPLTGLGWRGPYLLVSSGTYTVGPGGFTVAYGVTGDPALLDAWGNPIVLQYPTTVPDYTADEKAKYVRLVSAGPDGVIDSPPSALTPADLTSALRDDDVVLFLEVPDTP